jgi:UDP-N-acetylmuramyl pentapeptide synthase
VLEIGMNYKGEMDILAGRQPDYGLITNIGCAHIGPCLMDAIAAEKRFYALQGQAVRLCTKMSVIFNFWQTV